jgi:hypothetical protein
LLPQINPIYERVQKKVQLQQNAPLYQNRYSIAEDLQTQPPLILKMRTLSPPLRSCQQIVGSHSPSGWQEK